MDGNRYNPSIEVTGSLSQGDDGASVISIEQLQQLVRLLDSSDVSELELRRAAEGMHLVLRKVQAFENSDRPTEAQFVHSASNAASSAVPKETEHKVVAP